MLRFSYYRSDGGEQWDLRGELAGAWVDDLRAVWRHIQAQSSRGRAIVNLRDVTSIGETGEQLLAEMQAAGADFVYAGVRHQDVIANLKARNPRAVRRRIEYLDGGRR